MASFKKYRFPLLFGAILGGFATAFIYRVGFLAQNPLLGSGLGGGLSLVLSFKDEVFHRVNVDIYGVRQYFLPDVDEIRRQDYENFKEKLPELIAHRERVNEKRMQMIEAKKDQSS
ncbi:hypothetical protein HOLleu_28136 [Holothuria leucospilota]|uniref:Uncharacterized protein n=1 Tax=Holothuria leucospilota TaxID=206669 RepID=A0A9Q1BLR2_HOLLE|nr:hypothetical protein HOLleu_28136 [Holothuria leucospilota]